MSNNISNFGIIILLIVTFTPLQSQESNSIVSQKIQTLSANLMNSFSESRTGVKPVIAVSDFDNVGESAENMKIGETVGELIAGILSEFDGATIIERRNLNKLMEEMALQQAGFTSSETAAEVGNLLGAEYTIVGSVARTGSVFVINGRILNNATGKVIAVAYDEINANQLIVVSSELFSINKNRVLATVISIIPGMGQWFNDRPLKALIFTSATTILVGSALSLKQLGDDAYREYQTNTRSSVNKYDDASSYYDTARLALFGAVTIWAINLVDAWWDAGKLGRDVEKAKIMAKKIDKKERS